MRSQMSSAWLKCRSAAAWLPADREHAERPADRADLAQAEADDAHAVGVAGETLVEPGAPRWTLEPAGDLGEPDQRRCPVEVNVR